MFRNAMLTVSLHHIDQGKDEIALSWQLAHLSSTSLTFSFTSSLLLSDSSATGALITHAKKPLTPRPTTTTSPDIDNHLQTTIH
jgi:hypothetical protein